MMHTTDAGFTLTELLIVIAIVGVLSAIAIPVYVSQQGKAEDAVAANEVASAFDLVSSAALVAPDELARLSGIITPAGEPFTVDGVGSIRATGALGVIYDPAAPDAYCVQRLALDGTSWSKSTAGMPGPYTCADTPAPPLSLSYPPVTFTPGSDHETVWPTVGNATGPVTFTVTDGALPPNVTLSPTSGIITGPGAGDWTVRGSRMTVSARGGCLDLVGMEGIYCWGDNAPGTTLWPAAPTVLPGSEGRAWDEVSASNDRVCGRDTYGNISCWVDGDTNEQAVTLPAAATALSAGPDTTCAVADGAAYCWGDNTFGQLGDGTTTDSATPVQVLGGAQGGTWLTDVKDLSISAPGSVCAATLTNTYAAYCWGNNTFGQLGDGTTTDSLTPVRVRGGAQGGTWLFNAHQMVGFDGGQCMRTVGQHVYCWGSNINSQLGDNTAGANATVPVKVLTGEQLDSDSDGYLDRVDEVFTGPAANTVCATVTSEDDMYCWGRGDHNQLPGETATAATPVRVRDAFGALPLEVSLNAAGGCTVSVDGAPLCWGADGLAGFGWSGGTGVPTAVPAAPGFPAVVTIEVSDGDRTATRTVTVAASS